MAHEVHLHDSFDDDLDRLPPIARKQVLDIVTKLGENKFFEPDEETFVFERDDDKGISICQHINDWGNWQLLWYYRYVASLPSTVDYIEVRLVQQSMQRLQPNKA
jgi:hypothetical protein